MAVVQRSHIVFKLVAERFGRVVAVVQMDINVAEAATAQRGDLVDVFRVVFITRIKERMLWRPARGIG